MITPKQLMPELDDLQSKYELVSTLGGGTDAMREAGEDYLPKEPAETQGNYNLRLARSVLFPAYTNALAANTGKLFRNGLNIESSTPLFDPYIEDIDEEGNSIQQFSQTACISALDYGCSYILVDYPVVTPNATLADEIELGVKPYWVLINAPQVLEASPVKVMGKNKLGVFRFLERHAYRKDEFTLTYQERIKEFRLLEDGTVIYRVYIQSDSKWVLHDEGVLIGMSEIPVVPMYTKRVGYYLGSPLFYELAKENVLNWQITSDYQNILHITAVPMLKVTGVQSSFDDSGVKQEIAISPNTVLEFSNPQANAEWIEISGNSISALRDAINDSFTRMSEMSLEALTSTYIDQTATATLLDAEEAVSTLQLLQFNIEEAVNKAISLTYMYLGTENTNTTAVLKINDIGNMDEVTPVDTSVNVDL